MSTEINLNIERILLDKNIDMPVRTTIADVIMWLYAKHGVWIEVQHCGTFNQFGFKISKLDKNNIRIEPSHIHPFGKGFTSPTEAYTAAIEYTLKHLI